MEIINSLVSVLLITAIDLLTSDITPHFFCVSCPQGYEYVYTIF